MRTKSISATITDANNRACGTRTIQVVFNEGMPAIVTDRERIYLATGRRGTNRDTGLDVVELASAKDERVWLTLGGTHLYED